MKKLLLACLFSAAQFGWAQLTVSFPENSSSYDFGEIEIGDTAEVLLTLNNSGDTDIEVNFQGEVESIYPGIGENTQFCTIAKGAFNTVDGDDVNTQVSFVLASKSSKTVTVNFVPEQYSYQESVGGCVECKVAAPGIICVDNKSDSLGYYTSTLRLTYTDLVVFAKVVAPNLDVTVHGTGVRREVGLNDENEANAISLFPNPAVDVVNLSTASNWVLRTLSGMEVSSGNGSEINLTKLPKGVYLVELTEGDSVTIQKIVKK